jgi:exopolysaccharide biosynthesis polyprenyl glycosylphosphotransferase
MFAVTSPLLITQRCSAMRRHIICLFEQVNSPGGPARGRSPGAWGMASPESMPRASEGSPCAEFAHADVTGQESPEQHYGVGELRKFHANADSAVDLLDGSLALQPADHQLASQDQREAIAGFVAPVSARRRFAEWSLRYISILAAVEGLIGGVAAAVPASMSETLSANQAVPLLCLIGMLFWPAVVGLNRGYRRTGIGVGSDEFRAVILAGIVLVAACALPAGFMVLRNEALNPSLATVSPSFAFLSVAALGAPIAVVISVIARILGRKLLRRLQAQGRNIRRVVVAGSSAAAQQLITRIQREPHPGMEIVGLCVPSEELPRQVADGIAVLGSLPQVPDVVRSLGCDAVVVTSDDATRHDYLRRLAWSLEGSEAELLVDPGLGEITGPRLHIRPITGSPLVHVGEPHFAGWRRFVKRVSDVGLATLALAITAPIMLIIAGVVKLQDGGPVIFRQTRVGRGGELFTLLKFRSMVIDAEARKADLLPLDESHGALFKLRDDPRITRFGRFLRASSLDELPQLFNVLRGSMSLVGPRPHLAHELAQMPQEASRRLLVSPGVTGLWQVSGRSDLREEDGIRLDLRYVDNWSLTHDLQILWKTPSAVLARRGAR